MANTYRNAFANLTATGATAVYTSPSVTTAIVKSLRIVNVTTGTTGNVTVEVTDNSASTTYTFSKNVSIAAGFSQEMLGQDTSTTADGQSIIVLEESDALKVTTSAANVFHVTMAALEVT